MPTNTYVALDKITLGSNTASVTFSSINQGYTDLVIVFEGYQTGNGDSRIQYNSDTGSNTNYSETVVKGNGSTATSARSSNAAWSYLAYTDASIGRTNIIAQIQNYSNTTTYKTVLSRFNTAGSTVGAVVGMWRSTAAITSITISTSVYAYAAGSTFSLYGIAAASVGAKATGGTVYSDSQYYYHVFGATGTFTPLQSLSADVLVVAGGGGGGSTGVGGGGGAGGLLAYTSQSLTATNYTCQVGAGGAVNANGGGSQFASLTASVGGGAGVTSGAGGNGGSGGGGGVGSGAGGSATSGQGFAGGTGFSSTTGTTRGAGGGGGAGAVGSNGASGAGGVGGVGSSAYSSGWLSTTGIGQLVGSTYYIAGGGGGGSSIGTATTYAGGSGGGGAGTGSGTVNAIAGTANTGGGGGGGGTTSGVANSNGAAGGSGIVIVRYAK